MLFFAGSDAPPKADVADLIERLGFYGIGEGGMPINVPGGALAIQNPIRLDRAHRLDQRRYTPGTDDRVIVTMVDDFVNLRHCDIRKLSTGR